MTCDLVQKTYIRVCRDSGFRLNFQRAAALTADTLGISALHVALQFPHLSDLDDIARGKHPYLKEDT